MEASIACIRDQREQEVTRVALLIILYDALTGGLRLVEYGRKVSLWRVIAW